jgi:hypothetical protein
MKKLTQEEFIKRVTKIFQEKLDFSKSVYTIGNNKVKIICPKHGEFEKPACELMKGKGCTKCKNENRRKTQEEFIKEAINIWGNKYDLSIAKYTLAKNKIKIICKHHGIFEVITSSFLNNKIGCSKCGSESQSKKITKSQNKFIEEINNIHGDLYDLSKIKYTHNRNKIIVGCKKHGFFKIIAHNFLNGGGCKKCFHERQSKRYTITQDDFIKKVKKIHKNNYDLSLTFYNGALNKVKVICRKHGIFEILPRFLIKGKGCQKCSYENNGASLYFFQSKEELMKIKPAFVYINRIFNDKENFYKVGITKNNEQRLIEYKKDKNYTCDNVKLIEVENMFEAFDLEQLILDESELYVPQHKFTGHTECFKIRR